ncbi:hypothetical protein PUN28_011654 [Cardiocondyla obscurior]|uniref:Uncharacterized protein n=1 Tax=Cardiocondyla obscurior TaxID=286306 RepID=A0AAW2FK27_9HYME
MCEMEHEIPPAPPIIICILSRVAISPTSGRADAAQRGSMRRARASIGNRLKNIERRVRSMCTHKNISRLPIGMRQNLLTLNAAMKKFTVEFQL